MEHLCEQLWLSGRTAIVKISCPGFDSQQLFVFLVFPDA